MLPNMLSVNVNLSGDVMKKFNRLIAAVHTPIDSSDKIDFSVIEKQAEILIKNKLYGAFICGTTGESASLTVEERKDIAKTWMEVAGDQLQIYIHVGHNSVREACKLSEHAAKIGASYICTNSPSYYKPATVDALVDYCTEIALMAPELAFYFYHIPAMTGVHLSMSEFLRKGFKNIPNLTGLKYTGNNILEFYECLNLDNKKYDILYGNDEELLLALSLGATGAVGSTYNYAAPIFQKMINAFETGDMCTTSRCAKEVIEVISILYDYGLFAAGKAIMTLLGADCGHPRSPLRGLTQSQFIEMRQQLLSLEMFGSLLGTLRT